MGDPHEGPASSPAPRCGVRGLQAARAEAAVCTANRGVLHPLPLASPGVCACVRGRLVAGLRACRWYAGGGLLGGQERGRVAAGDPGTIWRVRYTLCCPQQHDSYCMGADPAAARKHTHDHASCSRPSKDLHVCRHSPLPRRLLPHPPPPPTYLPASLPHCLACCSATRLPHRPTHMPLLPPLPPPPPPPSPPQVSLSIFACYELDTGAGTFPENQLVSRPSAGARAKRTASRVVLRSHKIFGNR